MPVHPRGKRRRRAANPTLLIACARSSPAWELAAIHALMKPKPHTRGAIEHTSPQQPWPIDGEARVRQACAAMAERLGVELTPHFPEAGEMWLVLTLPADRWGEARGVSRVLSGQLPGCWLTLDRTFIKDGVTYVRERGFKLTLRKSASHPVPRTIAAKLRGLIVSL